MMKNKAFALLLAVLMALDSVGMVPVMASETTIQGSDQVQDEAEETASIAEEETEDAEKKESVSAVEEETEDAEEKEPASAVEEETAGTAEEKSIGTVEEGTSAVQEADDSASRSNNQEDDEEGKISVPKQNVDEEISGKLDIQKNDEINTAKPVESMDTDKEDDSQNAISKEEADVVIENDVKAQMKAVNNTSGPKNIEAIGGQYCFYTYATTYGNLSFNVSSNAYCDVVQGETSSSAGYYYYVLHIYPKDGGNNTIIEVYDNDSGNNIDILVVHSNYQETEAQTICAGKSIQVTFETIDEISRNNILVGSTGSDTSISYLFNSLTSAGVVLHGSGVPCTYKYSADITLNTPGNYTVNLMNNASYTTFLQIPVTVREHEYNSGVITSEPSCQSKAVLTKTCNLCGDKISEEVGEYADHTWSDFYTLDKAATCTEEGSESIHCSVCDAIDEDTVRVIPKENHSYGDWSVTDEATCTEDGSKDRICSICGDVDTEVISALGHVWDDYYQIHDATCTEDGYEGIYCSICGEVNPDTYHIISKTGHSYGNWTVTKKPNCTETGSKEKICEICDDKVTETIPATGHAWNKDYTLDKEATCTEEGSESIHCSVCDAIEDETVRAIPKKEHSYGEWTVTKEPTCSETGVKEKICESCNDTVTEDIPAKGHTWDEEYTVDSEATYTEDGSESIHCSVCGEIKPGTSRLIEKLTIPMSMLNVSGIVDKIYNGGSQTQTVVVKYGDTILEEDRDYKVSYYNNIEIGTATVIITGIGSYTGTIEVTFSIKRVGWYQVSDEDWHEYVWHYADENGDDVTGWKYINGKWYYFNNAGVMATGNRYIGGSYYRFNDSGAMITGWYQEPYGDWYYYLDSGKEVTGWQLIKKKWYYFDISGRMVTGEEYINGAYYRFNDSGAMITGWYQKSNGSWYYYLSSGKRASGWQLIKGKWYYFNDSMYADNECEIDDEYYRFTDNGAMVTGWYYNEYNWFYYLPSGKRASGWQLIKGKWYYFYDWGNMAISEQEINGSYYLFSRSGAMVTGWYKDVFEYWYYYLSNGKRANGWQLISGKWYYFNEYGRMKRDGISIIGGKGYKFAKSGYLMYANTTGWVKTLDGNGNVDYWYYVSKGGALAVGWKKISGKWYYFDTYSCEMYQYSHPLTIGKNGYLFGSNGAMLGEAGGWIKGPYDYKYYANKGGSLVTGWKNINGKWYYFDANGDYYMYRNGTYKINQKSYKFDENGVCRNK